MQDLCWGALTPSERNQILRDEQVAWQALFELREFKFPDVMRASVLPALELDPDRGNEALGSQALKDPAALAAICQLAGRTPDPARPLRYERLGSNRALFNLSRLHVPAAGARAARSSGGPRTRSTSARTGSAMPRSKLSSKLRRITATDLPDIPLLAGPELFEGLLSQFRDLQDIA